MLALHVVNEKLEVLCNDISTDQSSMEVNLTFNFSISAFLILSGIDDLE